MYFISNKTFNFKYAYVVLTLYIACITTIEKTVVQVFFRLSAL